MEIEGVGSLRNIGAVFWKFHEAMIDDRSNEYIPVSYTHLTLPTSDLV